jgi:NAD(P)-dependent dehydrogenase (short-subunit alcohol dehydrogenase family)
MRVLITGTSTGIGLATAVELGRAGHTVFATMRNPSQAPQLGEIVAQERLPVSILTMDVDSDESVIQVVGQLHQNAEALDVLVNNAGIDRMGSIEELPMEACRAVMETNYFGSLRCIRAVGPKMRENRSGCIITVTSVAGRIACSPWGPYAASKWALEALSEALAQELKPFNIRVAIVQPGIIDTPMATRVGTPGGPSLYPQGQRMASLVQASLAGPRPPAIVAQKIREIIESGTWRLRHPAGPDAEPFLAWRGSMTDEAWIEWGALDDDSWYARVEQDFGLNARPKKAITA